MDPTKVEFKRLVELMGWSQTMAARRLHKTPSAINHLINPDHPNKPSPTTMQLLKVIIAGERPDLINPQTFQLQEAPAGAKPHAGRLSPRERKLIEALQKLPPAQQEKVYAIIDVLLEAIGRKGGKAKK
ncbi:MAG TPA: helix-turn-helix transcriptional regulator [Verrucomicrobiae bacterium]|jgi:plasmid maintenance system antidote protein VapI|nr:helix-turn-helix transcriptional regulator [Verrucomicrobiae bacterium]